MANFRPWKRYFWLLIDELVAEHKLIPPLIDIGCGIGETVGHFTRKGWQSTGLELSPDAAATAHVTVSGLANASIVTKPLTMLPEGAYNTAILMDVLEHVSDDVGMLREISKVLSQGGHLLITVPSNPKNEWGWDDDFYGHLRRYTPESLVAALKDGGFSVIKIWDASFPVFWALRRGFLFLKKPKESADTTHEKTLASSGKNAWDMGIISFVLNQAWYWWPVFQIMRLFRGRPDRGNELMVLAKKAA